jgi:hypothetical protein
MPLTSITAWEGWLERLGFVPQAGANTGKRIVIIGGLGGVGSVAIQLVRWAGLTVFATASRAETVKWCRHLGAVTILNHRNDLHRTPSGCEHTDQRSPQPTGIRPECDCGRVDVQWITCENQPLGVGTCPMGHNPLFPPALADQANGALRFVTWTMAFGSGFASSGRINEMNQMGDV